MSRRWTDKEVTILKRNYPLITAAAIAAILDRPLRAVYVKAFHLGLEKPDTATVWTQFMINFLKSQYHRLTNPQLAKALGLNLTVTRNKMRELGIKRMEMEYFTDEMLQYFLDNYRTKGNVELAIIFNQKFPKNKKWTSSHFSTKMRNLKLERTPAEVDAIKAVNHAEGGRCYTIDRNSSSINLHPTWVAQRIAWRDKELQQELLKHPELIDTATQMYKLKRVIKQKNNQTS